MVGSNLRLEMPLLAHRLRKAAVKARAQGWRFLNPERYEYLFPVAAYLAGVDLKRELAAVVRAAAVAGSLPVPPGVPEVTVTDHTARLRPRSSAVPRHAVILGTLAQRHPAYAELKALAAQLAELTHARLGLLTEGAECRRCISCGCGAASRAGRFGQSDDWPRCARHARGPAQGLCAVRRLDPAADFAAGADAPAAADLILAVTTHLTTSCARRHTWCFRSARSPRRRAPS